MPAPIDLTGQRVGTLLIQERVRDAKNRVAYRCLCDCGVTKVMRGDLLSGGSKRCAVSCGCLTPKINSEIQSGKPHKNIRDFVGQRFGRLVVLENLRHENKFSIRMSRCLCDCGKEVVVRNCHLTQKKEGTVSCGCHAKELSKENILHAIAATIKYTPEISAARQVWCRNYSDGLSFDDFAELSRLDCHYCGSVPNNSFIHRGANFLYSGLDRIDSSLGHNVENVVPCCKICNFAKNDRSIDDFMDHIKRLTVKSIDDTRKCRDQSKSITMENVGSFKLTTIRIVFRPQYDDGDLSLEQFYQLSQMNCFYCNQVPSNITKSRARSIKPETLAASYFTYNGLDRVNNDLLHNYDNVVPCCRYCNAAKLDMSFDDFIHWVEKIKAHNA